MDRRRFLHSTAAATGVGYDRMMIPDHKSGAQALAYAFGYINALIQLVNQES